MRILPLALAIILGSCTHALCTELWIIKQRGCVACEEFRVNVLPEYRKAEERDTRLPVLIVKDADNDRREVMSPRIKRLWYATPSFVLVEDDGTARAIHPGFYNPLEFIEDVMQAAE